MYRENTDLLFGEESPILRKRFVETMGTKNDLPRPTQHRVTSQTLPTSVSGVPQICCPEVTASCLSLPKCFTPEKTVSQGKESPKLI